MLCNQRLKILDKYTFSFPIASKILKILAI